MHLLDPRDPAPWSLVSDQVMGGVSDGILRSEEVAGRTALRMRGDVSLANDGGFLQMARDLDLDASDFAGIAVTARGDGGSYNVHLRTPRISHPWQSWRTTFRAEAAWHTHRLPFDGFAPHRIDAALDPARLTRIGLVAIGEAGPVDLSVAEVALYAA